MLTIPAAGTGQDGQACQTTRDCALIDQDQSGKRRGALPVQPGGPPRLASPAAGQETWGLLAYHEAISTIDMPR